MVGHLRTFAWLRWRLFVNTLTRTGRRSSWERVGLALESLGPLVTGLVLLPAAGALAVLGGAAGYVLGAGHAWARPLFAVLRVAALVVLVVAALAPVLSAGGRRPADLVRLLLLPIPRRVLYGGELAGALADPWLAVALPLCLCVPAGAAAAGRPALAAAAAVAGALLVALAAAIAVLASTLAQLLLRRRRLAELFGLGLAFLPLVLAFSNLLAPDGRARREAVRRDRIEHRGASPAPVAAAPGGWRLIVPSELYAATLARAAAGEPGVLATAGSLLVVTAGAHALAWRTYRRALGNPTATGAGEQLQTRAVWTRRLPGLTPAASAVAAAQIRLALRTPRGRMILATPLVLLVFFSVPLLASGRGPSFGPLPIGSGLALTTVLLVFGVVAAGPMTLNQFAVDGPGLTLELLAPVTDRELLLGKAAGLGLASGGSTLAAVVLAAIVVPPASMAVWLALVVAFVAALVILAPVWALVSAAFPRPATLASLRSSASNPHPAAGFLGFGALAVAAAPPAALAVFALAVAERPAWLLPSMLGWLAVACVASRALFNPAAALFARRRETLAFVAQGRR
jgi:hypothetical protein